MTYALYGAMLAFAWFLAVNVCLSLLVAALTRRMPSSLARLAPATRARVLLGLRLLPAAASIFFVLAVFLPSFWTLEPRDFDEAFGLTTMTLAFVACGVLLTAARRGTSALQQAAARSRAWLQHAVPIVLPGAPAPVFCLDAPIPAMTLVGVFRPKLLVTRPLIEALTRDELDAAVAHEAGHFGSRDNLKRLVMRATPDALSLLGASRRLEQGWALASEHAADARAARDSNAGLALAAALVKVARLTPADRVVPLLASPLVGGEAIAARVERLMDLSPRAPSPVAARVAGWTAAAGMLAALAAGYTPLLGAVHRLSEVVVHALP